jgi:glycosyltransferase involved in cell wall biosynthesis
LDVAINALGLLRDRLPRAELTVVGDGEQRESLERLAQFLRIADRVHFRGSSGNVVSLMQQADFLISASRYEGLPNVVLEALGVGTPVVATDCPGGTRDLVIEGLTGWLCTPDSGPSMADAIARAVVERPQLKAEAIRKFVADNYAANRIVASYARVLLAAAGRI